MSLGFCSVTGLRTYRKERTWLVGLVSGEEEGKEGGKHVSSRRRGRVFRRRRNERANVGEGRGGLEGGGRDGGLPSVDQEWLVEYSREFLSICQGQFEVLMEGMNASFCVLYLRRNVNGVEGGEEDGDGERGKCGVEFVPVCTYPENGMAWVVGEGSAPRKAPPRLPGGIAASVLVPEYPYVFLDDSNARVMNDGSLTVPIITGHDVVGILAVWKNDRPTSVNVESGIEQMIEIDSTSWTRPVDRCQKEEKIYRARTSSGWTPAEKALSREVAQTLSLACALDQRAQASERSRREQVLVLAQLRSMLATVLHQVRSPLGALLTFGKLLLRRLPVGDVSRDLAKDIIVQSQRMQDLLHPLDEPVDDDFAQNQRRLRLPKSSERRTATDVPYFELTGGKENSNAANLSQANVTVGGKQSVSYIEPTPTHLNGRI